MKATPKKGFSFLTQAALASTIFCVSIPAFAALAILTDASNGSNSSVVSPAGGYDYQNTSNDVTFTILDATTVDNTSGVAIDKTSGTKAANMSFAGGPSGNSVVNGSVGVTNPITLITINSGANVNNLQESVTFQTDTPPLTINVNTIFVNDNGVNPTILILNDPTLTLTGNITTTTNPIDVVNVENATSITGNIGSSSASFGSVWVGQNQDLVVDGNIFAGDVFFFGDNNLFLAENSSITGNVNANLPIPNEGTLNFDGTGFVTGIIGGFGQPIKAVSINGVNATVTLGGDVTTLFGLNFADSANAATTLILNNGVTVNTNIDNLTGANGNGVLQFAGSSTITGMVGLTNALSGINFMGNGSTVNFDENTVAQTIDFKGTTTANFDGNVTGNINFFTNGTAVIADTMVLTGSADNLSGIPGTGSLIYAGSSDEFSSIGATNSLANLTINSNGGPGASVTLFSPIVNANQISVIGPTTTLTLNNTGMLLTGNITTNVNNTNILNVALANTLTGNIGTPTAAFNELDVVQNQDLLINGSVYAISTILQGNNTLSFGPNVTITSTLSTATPNTGNLQFLGSANVNGTLGSAAAPLVDIFLNGPGAMINFNGNVFASDVVFDMTSNAATTLTLADGVNVTANIDNSELTPVGTLQFAGASTITGSIGATTPLNAINFLGNGKTVSVSGDVSATTLTFSGTTTASLAGNLNGNTNFNADGTLIIADTKNITGNVDNTLGLPIGTVDFLGSSTVSGTVGATHAIKVINIEGNTPDVVDFQQSVAASNISISGTSTSNFSGDITGNITYSADGAVTLADGQTLTGNVDALSANIGTLSLLGAGKITGNIGATEPLKLLQLNLTSANPDNVDELDGAIVNAQEIQVYDNGTPTTVILNNPNMVLTTQNGINNLVTGGLNILNIVNAQQINSNIGSAAAPFSDVKVAANNDTTINGNVYSTTVEFQGNNTLTLTNNSSIFGNVITDTNGSGKLTLEGTSNVTGSIGAPGLALNLVTVTGNGNIDFGGNLYTNTLDIDGLATVDISGNVTTNINFLEDGTVDLGTGSTLTGNVDNLSGSPNIGTFNFVGSGTVTGNMGNSSPLKLIQVNSAGVGAQTATLTGNVVDAQTININDNGAVGSTLVLNNAGMDLTGNITATTNNLDILDIQNADTITGNIGTATQALNMIDVALNGNTTILGNSIYATTTEFQGNNTLFLGNNETVNGAIDSTATNQGILSFLGNSTVTGTIGNTNSLNTINLTGNSTTVSLLGNVNVGTGNLNFAPGSTQTSTLILGDGVNVTGSINNTTGTDAQGTLQFQGNGSVSGTIGNVPGPNQSLFAVNLLGGAGKVVTLNQVNANTINVLNAGTLNLNGNSTANVNFSNPGVVNLGDGDTLTGNVNNLSGLMNIGTFNFVGGGTVTGNIGVSNPLNQITANTSGAAGKTVTLNGGTVRANSILINDGGSPTVLVLDNPLMKLTGNITATSNNVDELNILNATSLTGNIGAPGTALNLIDVGQNVNTTINGNIFSTLTEFQGNNTLFLGNNSNVTGNIDTATADTGTLTFLGNSFVTGTIGAANPLFAINVTGNGTSTVNLQSNVFVGPGDLNFAPNAQTRTTLLLNDGVTVTGNIDNTTGADNIGILQFKGAGAVTGTIGATNSLYAINLTGGAGKVVTLDDNVNVGTGDLNFAPGSTPTTELDLGDGVTVTGNIDNTTGTDGNGTLDFLGNGEVTGTIGASNKINLINLNGGPGKTVNFVNTVNANGINFTADSAATFGNNFNLITPITTTTSNQGTATFLGNATIGAQIGSLGKSLKAVNFNGIGNTTVTLDADIFALNTNLNHGTLITDGNQTLTGNLNVNSGSTLRVDTDNTPLNVLGVFNLNANGTLDVNLNSQLASTGFVKATIANISPNAHLTVTNAPTVFAEGIHKYVIVDGGPGSVINVLPVSGDSLLLTFETIADNINNDLILEIDAKPIGIFANQSNTTSIAGALDALTLSPPADGPLRDILNALVQFQDAATLNRDLAALAPIVDGAVFYEPMNTQIMAYDTFKQRLRYFRTAKEQLNNPAFSGFASGGVYNGCQETWGKIFGRTSDQQRRFDVDGYQNHMFGFAIGSDVLLNQHNLVGAAASYANLKIDHAVSDSTTTINNYQIGLYGQHEFIKWELPLFFNWETSIGYNHYDTQQNFQFANLFFSPSEKYSGWMIGGDAEIGYDYAYNCWHILPLASLFYSYLGIDSYTQSGMGNANQHVDSKSFNLLRGGLGVRAMFDLAYTKHLTTIVLQPEMHAMAFYDFVNDGMSVTSEFVGGGPSFVTSGFDQVRDLYNLGVSLSTFGKTSNLIFTVSYDYETKKSYKAHNGFFRVGYEW